MSLNKLMLIGHVGKDPDIRILEAGSKVATFSFATTEKGYTLANGTQVPERTEWHNVVVWRGLADVVEKYVHKGDKLYLEGKIRTRSYDDSRGITGGVGAGKSTVLDFLEEKYQAYVMKADEIGHLVMEPGQSCYEPVIALFGRQIIKNDKTIDRRQVSDVVFSHPELLEKLNQIIHPAVKQYIREQLAVKKQQGQKICVVEAALLLEDHYQEFCDTIWYIHTDEEIRIRRLMENRGYTREKSVSIIASQAPETFFRENADYVVVNNGDFAQTRRQIEEGIRKYETL